MPTKNKTLAAQIRRMFGLGRPLGCGKEDLEDLALDVTAGRTHHLSELTFDEANGVIERLGGGPFSGRSAARSGRSVQRDRQLAGVPNIDVRRQQMLLKDLWLAIPGRTLAGLEKMCLRTIKVPAPRTTAQANSVIEAVKAMNRRARTAPKEAA